MGAYDVTIIRMGAARGTLARPLAISAGLAWGEP